VKDSNKDEGAPSTTAEIEDPATMAALSNHAVAVCPRPLDCWPCAAVRAMLNRYGDQRVRAAADRGRLEGLGGGARGAGRSTA
jgi:hypothetical protein